MCTHIARMLGGNTDGLRLEATVGRKVVVEGVLRIGWQVVFACVLHGCTGCPHKGQRLVVDGGGIGIVQ